MTEDDVADPPLIRAGDEALLARDAIAILDMIDTERPAIDRLIDVCLIEAELARDPIEVGNDVLQETFDRLRRAKGLYTIAETEQWLARRGLTMDVFERCAHHKVAAAALRDRVTSGRVEAHFAANRDAYDTAAVARLEVPDQEPREALYAVVAARTLEEALGAWMTHATSAARLRIEKVTRGTLSESMRAAIFELPIGQLRQVRETGSNWFVHTFVRRRAELDESTRALIADQLFAAFLDERLAAGAPAWSWTQP
jgi:putative peptide maturation system protein